MNYKARDSELKLLGLQWDYWKKILVKGGDRVNNKLFMENSGISSYMLTCF